MKILLFLTRADVDLVRSGAAETTHVKPLDPLGATLRDLLDRGGVIWACTPCAKRRGCVQELVIDGVVVAGAAQTDELIKGGATTLSF